MGAYSPASPSTERPVGRRFDAAPNGTRHRLVHAFGAVERFPALAEPRDRFRELVARERLDAREIVSVVESDAALALPVLSAASQVHGRDPILTSVPRAVDALPHRTLELIASRVPGVDFFESSTVAAAAQAYRMHALATQQAAEAIRIETNRKNRDELAISALLHDIGKVVLLDAYDSYPEIGLTRDTPEERLALEREALGVDHAMTGAAVARRLGLPARLTATIAGHHGGGESPEAAIVRLADMLAHFESGQPVDPRTLESVAHEVGLPRGGLRALLYSVHRPADTGARAFDPSPLSGRQHEILRLLAIGKANKEIARELGLTPSTVRSHQHSIYTKLDVADRAQAVLLASRRGWI